MNIYGYTLSEIMQAAKLGTESAFSNMFSQLWDRQDMLFERIADIEHKLSEINNATAIAQNEIKILMCITAIIGVLAIVMGTTIIINQIRIRKQLRQIQEQLKNKESKE